MTSTTDMTQHPDISEISDLAEGLLPPSRTTDVRRHIEGCELCSDVQASLEEIQGLLGSMPAPQPMPADIADRIDAALADEARSARSAPPAQADVSHAAKVDVSRETEPSSTVQELTDRPAGHSRAATGPGRRSVRRRRRTAVLGTALGAAVVGVSVFLLQNVTSSQNSGDLSSAERKSDASKTGSQTFSQSTLEERVHTLLSSSPAASSPKESDGGKQAPSMNTKSSPQTAPPGSASPQAPLRAPAVSVPSCIEQGIGRNTTALAVEKGTYEGTDAFLVVMPHPMDETRVEAYVVDAACVGADPAPKGKLLLTHAYARR
ncbi:anti-sigma factor family protein [Streptomyces sp. NPDC058221]|uniref:anti-sigma factor family protein n=1 Tax=Streptomyces sp. NPDC058221 TaxID=3346388 RepID=UPI0036F06A6A